MEGTPGGILSVFIGAVRYSAEAIGWPDYFTFRSRTPARKRKATNPELTQIKRHRFPVSFFHESTGPFSFPHSFIDRGWRDGFAYCAVGLLSPRFFASLR